MRSSSRKLWRHSRKLCSVTSANDHTSGGGVFSYFPLDVEGLFSTPPSLSKTPFSSPAVQQETDHLRDSSISVGTASTKFHVSPVFQEYGHLWQWRSISVPVTTPDEKKQSFLSFMVPFLVHPGKFVHEHYPIISSAAVESVSYELQKVQPAVVNSSSLLEVRIPSAIGLLSPIIISNPEERSSRASHPASNQMHKLWASSYFDLLDLMAEWEADNGPPTKVISSFPHPMQPNYGTATMESPGLSTLPSKPRAALDAVARHALPSSEAGEGETRYAERWSLNHMDLLPAVKRKALIKIPSSFRNIVGGGFAEFIISLDRYAALIARGELTIPAACWALLCDISHPEVVHYLRTHAVALQEEVAAATAAHKSMMRNALETNHTLIGKTCGGGIHLLNYPLNFLS